MQTQRKWMRLVLQLAMVSCLALLGATACGGDDGQDPSIDVGGDDGGLDDSGSDAGQDGGSDAGQDSGSDAGQDGGSDAEPDTSANACSPNPCQNGGVCGLESDGYHCECADGFFGFDCEYRSEFDPQCTDGTCTSAGRIYNPGTDPDDLSERTITLRDEGQIVDDTTLDAEGFYAFTNAPRATLEKSLQQSLDDEIGPEPQAGCDDCTGACWNGFCYTHLPADRACISTIDNPAPEVCLEPSSAPGGSAGAGPNVAHAQFSVREGASSQNALEIITGANIAPLASDYVIAFTEAGKDKTDLAGELILAESGEISGEVSIVLTERFGQQREVAKAVVDNANRTFVLQGLRAGTYDIRVGDDSFENWEELRLSRDASVSLANDPNSIEVGGIEITVGPGPFNPNSP